MQNMDPIQEIACVEIGKNIENSSQDGAGFGRPNI